MKIEVIGKEVPEGYEIEVEMKGEMNLKYVPQAVQFILDGIACHGKDVEMAVVMGIADFMERVNRNESIF